MNDERAQMRVERLQFDREQYMKNLIDYEMGRSWGNDW